MAAQAKPKQGVLIPGTLSLSQREVAKFAKDGWTCTCMVCDKVVKVMRDQGQNLKLKMSHMSQNVIDQVIAGNKNATVEVIIGGSPCEEKRDFISSQTFLSSYFKCKDCENTVHCQYSEFSQERCTTLDALLFPLCGSMLFPRENLRKQASFEGFSSDDHVYYQLSNVLTETIVR
jgi:hypothetical protein